MRLIDAELAASNLRDAAADMQKHLPIIAEAYRHAANMIEDMPITVDVKEREREAYKRGYIEGSLQQSRIGIK